MRGFDLKATRYFRAVVNTGSFSAAAERSSRTQQAISKSVQQLEEGLGIELLDRSLGRITPTIAGRHLLDSLESIEAELARLEDAINTLKGEAQGRVTIGISPSAEPSSFGRVLLDMATKDPDYRITINAGTSHDMLPEMLAQKLDIFLALEMSDDTIQHPRLERYELGTDCFCIVVGENHPLASCETVELQDLASYPWIVGRYLENLQAQIWRAFQKENLKIPRFVTSNSLTFVLEAMLSSPFITILPSGITTSRAIAHRLCELPFAEFRWERPLCLYTSRQARLRKHVAKVLAALESTRS